MFGGIFFDINVSPRKTSSSLLDGEYKHTEDFIEYVRMLEKGKELNEDYTSPTKFDIVAAESKLAKTRRSKYAR